MSTVLQNQPLPPEARVRLEETIAHMRKLETDGVDELLALRAEHPESIELLGHLAGALGYRGDHEGAVRAYDELATAVPGNLEVKWRKADRLVNLHKLDEALTLYREVLDVDPELIDAKMGVRYVHYLQRKEKRAGHIGIQQIQLTNLQSENRELNNEEYTTAKLKLDSKPHRLYLESTVKCNFACQMCSKGYESYYAEDLQQEIYERVKTELIPYNTRISITGFGEPTMAENFDELLETSLHNGSSVHFVTNASLLNFERIEQITACPVDIIISIDGATKETFEAVRQNSNFDLILEKLAMIKKLRDIAMSRFVSRFSFHFVAMRMNIHDLPGVVELAAKYGISHVGVLDYAFNDIEFDEQSLRYEPVRGNQFMDEAKKRAEELGVGLFCPDDYEPIPPPTARDSLWKKIKSTRRVFPQRNRFPRRCSSPWTEPYIHTDGRVTPCCTSNEFLGDLKKDRFDTIWNNWRYKMLRWRIESTLPPMRCRKCFNSWGINAANSGNVIAKEGLLVKAFYWCEYRWERLIRKFYRVTGIKDPTITDQISKAPNFYQGKPIKGKNMPPKTGSTCSDNGK